MAQKKLVKVYLYEDLQERAASYGLKVSTLGSMVFARFLGSHQVAAAVMGAVLGPTRAQQGPNKGPGRDHDGPGMGPWARHGPNEGSSGPIPALRTSIDPYIHESIDPSGSTSADRDVNPESVDRINPTLSPDQPARGAQRVTTALRAGNLNRAQETAFLGWWEVVPRKRAKGHGRRAYAKALAKGVTPERLVEAMVDYAIAVAQEGREPSKIKHPATWLNAECWDDEEVAPAGPIEVTTSVNVPTAARQREDLQAQLAALEQVAKERQEDGLPTEELMERVDRLRGRLRA